jgi:hypothetical protein
MHVAVLLCPEPAQLFRLDQTKLDHRSYVTVRIPKIKKISLFQFNNLYLGCISTFIEKYLMFVFRLTSMLDDMT